jgi:CBS domain-containing protein
MATVASILAHKGHLIYSIAPDATILEALKLMDEKDIGALLVMKGEKVEGIFSERDYARRGTLKGNTEKNLVKTMMTDKVFYVGPDQSVETCLAQMTDKHIRHLPVVKDGKVVGVVSIGDVVMSIIHDRESLIKGLENFILGRDLKQ